MARIPVIAALGALALSGCVSVLPEQDVPNALYRFPVIAPSAGLAADLVVREPSSARVLGGQGMVAEGPDGGLRLISGAEWAGRLTGLMQYGLIDALSGEGAGTAVTALSGAPGAYELSWRIKDMTISGEVARCALSLTLMDGRSRAPLRTVNIEETEPVTGRDPEERARALSMAGEQCVEAAAVAVSAAVEAHHSAAGGGTDG